MKTRLFPAFATFAILALAAVAPAQDRGRRDGGGSRERSSPSRSGGSDRSGGGDRSRGESRGESRSRSDSSGRDSSRSRDDSRSSRPDRSDSRPSDSRSGGSRSNDSRPWDRSSGDSRPSRGGDGPRRDESRPGDRRPDDGRSPDRGGRDGRPSDSRPSDVRPSDSRNDGSRRNPFDRSERPRDARPGDRGSDRPNDRADRGGWPGRSNDRPGRPGTPESDSGRRNPFDRSGGFGGRDDRRPSGGYGGRDGRGGDDRNPGRGGFGGWNDRRPNRPVYAAPSRYDGRGRFDRPVRYATPPIHSVLGVQIRRSDARRGTSFAFGGVFGGLRVGYVSYGGGWNNYGFGYTHYAYDPFAPDCAVVASPWYRYSYLPPYIDNTRVIVVNNYPSTWTWDGWRTYDVRSDRRDEAVQGALDDLRDAFEEASDRYANRLIPQDGNVAIYNDGRYDYSLNPDDFAQMFLDGVEQSKTIRYEIQEVRTQGDEIRVRARHTYEDSWGEEQSVIHTLTLRRGRDGGYVIREFGSE